MYNKMKDSKMQALEELLSLIKSEMHSEAFDSKEEPEGVGVEVAEVKVLGPEELEEEMEHMGKARDEVMSEARDGVMPPMSVEDKEKAHSLPDDTDVEAKKELIDEFERFLNEIRLGLE